MWALNGVYTSNSTVYGDLHAADMHVPETIANSYYHMLAMCNDWAVVVVWTDNWHVPEAAMHHKPVTFNDLGWWQCRVQNKHQTCNDWGVRVAQGVGLNQKCIIKGMTHGMGLDLVYLAYMHIPCL